MKFFRLSLLLFLAALFTACEEEHVIVPKDTTSHARTVLVYMAADNSLTSFALEDLEEMRTGMAEVNDPNACLLVYVDDGRAPRLLELRNRDGEVVETTVRQYEDRNSVGEAETREVFDYAFSNYPADSYGLVYWSHCDAWSPARMASTRWVGQDTGQGTDYMELSELADILSTCPHLDFLLFDACFMSSVETAYELRRYTDFYVGSPTENPGPGAPYDAIMPYMFTPGAAAQMAQAYFEVYEDKYNGGIGMSNANWTGGTSICATRCDALEPLAAATTALVNELAGMYPEGLPFSELRQEVLNYDKRRASDSFYVGYYDFQELMQQLAGDDTTTYPQWQEAFDAAIVYWNTTSKNYSMTVGMFSMEEANGLSHYIPALSNRNLDAYHALQWYQDTGLGLLGW